MSEKDLILQALEDPKWDWRTVEGIARETGVPAEKVTEVLESAPEDVIRSTLPDKLGRSLYTTRRHYKKTQSFLNRFRST